MKRIIFCLIFLISEISYAGQNCETGSMKIESILKSLDFANTVINKLNSIDPEGNNVFLIGRIGQDISKYNQKYSHGAYAYKENGHWIVTHELNMCNSDQSFIYQDGLANFYLDDLFKFESVLVTFKEPYNSQLKVVLKNKSLAIKMHKNKYNMVAFPYSTQYQNSNGWLLETMILVAGQVNNKKIDNREDAQKFLKELNYIPATIGINPVIRLGGRLTKSNIAFDDQPFNDRVAGNIQLVTFDGLIPFFKQNSFIDSVVEITEN